MGQDQVAELPKKYAGAMPDSFFRKLTDEEEREFRTWARNNHKAGGEVDPCWHPVVRNECYLIDREGGKT